MNAPEDTDHKLEDLIATQDMRIARMRSAPAPSDPTGPLPVVGSGGVVGLRSESAEALAAEWEDKAVGYMKTAPAANNPAHRERIEAVCDTLWHCARQLRRRMEAETVRQPEPNQQL